MIDTNRLDKLVADLQGALGAGLLATDIWERESRKSLASFMHQSAAVDLFGTLAVDLANTLGGAGFPKLNRYFVLDLETDKAVIVILHGTDLLQGMLLDTRQTNMGIALSLGLRTAVEGVKAARA